MKDKAQVLLLVLFMLILSGTLITGLGAMWRAEISMSYSEKEGLLAFYLAQAGIERAKAELRNDWNWGGLSDVSLGAGTYDISVSNPGSDRRSIVSSGSVRDALRQITVTIKRTGTDPGPYGYNQVSNSWREM